MERFIYHPKVVNIMSKNVYDSRPRAALTPLDREACLGAITGVTGSKDLSYSLISVAKTLLQTNVEVVNVNGSYRGRDGLSRYLIDVYGLEYGVDGTIEVLERLI